MTEQNNQLKQIRVLKNNIIQLRKDYEQLQKEREKFAQAIDELKRSLEDSASEWDAVQK